MTRIIAILALGVGLSISGCKKDYTCAEWCDAMNACPDNPGYDCTSYCADFQTAADTAHCNTSYDTFLGCVGDHTGEICGDMTSCTAEGFAFFGCMMEFCNTHPDDPACASAAN